jgi:hypothetical protein
MAFYHGRGVAFWKPSSEKDVRALTHAADPLARFPSEPPMPPGAYEADELVESRHIVEAVHGDWNELNGLAAHLSQTCERIEELAARTEGLLRRVEHLAAATSSQLEHTGLLPTPVHVAQVRARVAEAMRPRLAPRENRGRRRLQVAYVRVRTELVTLWLVARVKVIRYASIPAKRATATLRKRLVLARMLAAIHLERWLEQARTAFAPRATPVKVTLSIHPPSFPRVPVPGMISATSAVALSAVVTVLLTAIGAPPPVFHLPPVLQPTLAMTLPGPMLFDALVSPPMPAPGVFAAASVPPATLVVKNGPVEPFRGTLVIESDPIGATVFVNRERVGETPLTLPDLRVGSRVVWLESDGYQRWSAGVRVSADQRTRLSVKLTRDPDK